jgi:hypothetical protein
MNSVIKVVFCALVGIFYYMCLMSFPYQNDKGEVTVYTKQPNAILFHKVVEEAKK